MLLKLLVFLSLSSATWNAFSGNAIAGHIESSTTSPIAKRQGLEKKESEKILDENFKKTLDDFLMVYKTPNLLTNHKKILELFNVTVVTHDGSSIKPNVLRTTYYEKLKREKNLEDWSWSYFYRAPEDMNSGQWQVIFKIEPPSEVCINSKAVEGYLDLDLDPGWGVGSPITQEKTARHVANYATPTAPALNNATPSISFHISHGCLKNVSLIGTYFLKEVNDADAYK